MKAGKPETRYPPFSTDADIRGPKKPGLYSDSKSRGLYLKVSDNGGKSFVFRYRDRRPDHKGKQPRMGLGPYGKHDVTLEQARKIAATYRQQLREGIDPMTERERVRGALAAAQGKIPTFDECKHKYIAAHSPSWKNPKHKQQWENTLTTYAGPIIGKLPVNMVTDDHVLQILEPIWTTKTETANRVRGRIEKVLDLATARKYRDGLNPARWKGHLDAILAKPGKLKKVTHHKSLPYSELYGFIQELRTQKGIAARCLEFAILTATRTGEVIAAQWSEFDLQANVWTIPAERMKAGRTHKVPLSQAAIDVLAAQKGLDDTFVFPGAREGKHLSNMAMLELLKDMEKTFTTHGFRASFRTWADEETHFARNVCESALAHTIKDKVEAAYLHESELLEKRTALMERWSQHCTTKPVTKGKVTEFKAA